MNLHMIRPKKETENLLRSVTNNCDKPIKQTHTKPQGTLGFRLTKPRDSFHFRPSDNLDFDCKRWLDCQV